MVKRLSVIMGACLLLWVVYYSGTAWSARTGLKIIPTAQLLKAGQWDLEYQHQVILVPGAHRQEWHVLLQYGLPRNLEVGVDIPGDKAQNRKTLFNGKLRLLKETIASPSLAVAACDLGGGSAIKPTYYLVASKDLIFLRAHAGGMQRNNKTGMLVGLERELFKRLTLQAEYTDAQERVVTVGASVKLLGKLGLLGYYEFHQPGASPDTYSVHLTWMPKF